MMKKRYAVVGLGVRGLGMFLRPLLQDYTDVAEVVAVCDVNPKRMDAALKEVGREDIPRYTDFDKMLQEVPCDAVVITTVDRTHDELIVKTLQAGKDAITEKPMTIDDARCRRILAAEKASRGTVRVTFNYRYAPYATRIKELLMEGVIGEVYSVDFAWYLDTVHGADYYRRWHRQKENSGGLFVHKATHHFDLVNWWLGQDPVRVYASGGRNFYGANRKERGERCQTCNYKDTCEFYWDISKSDRLRRLYLEAEDEDGYYRDRCVFGEEINIEDTMSAIVNYSKGVQLTYTLHSFMPFEGWRIAFNGSKGRLEAGVAETYFTEEKPNFAERNKVRTSMDPIRAARGELEKLTADEIRIYPLYGGSRIEYVPRAEGGHGGGDIRLRDMLFRPNVPDPLGHAAGSRAGAMSILIGVAANKSMATGMPIEIADLLQEHAVDLQAGD